MRTLLFLCLCVEALARPMLTYYETSKTWAEAQGFCRKHHTDLPTVLDVKENALIARDSWLGLSRKSAQTKWTWSAGNVSLSYDAPWAAGEPGRDGHCVYNHSSGWKSMSCSEKHSFFCADEATFLVTEKKTWEDALEHCRSIQKNVSLSYDLAVLPRAEEQKTAQILLQARHRVQVWVGLRFLGRRWMWVSGEDVPDHSCPSVKRCGTLRVNMTAPTPLNTKLCHLKTFFLCSLVSKTSNLR